MCKQISCKSRREESKIDPNNIKEKEDDDKKCVYI